jgi:RNA polymerase sigma factor (sigma-70 family)
MAGSDRGDLCQDVCARALRYQASFDQRKALLPWLRVCLMRERADQLRRFARTDRKGGYESEPCGASLKPRAQNAERVQALLEALEPLDAMLLRRFHLEQRSVNELALASGLAPGSVRSRLHLLRQAPRGHRRVQQH